MIKTTIFRLGAATAIVLLITYVTWGFRRVVDSQECALPWWSIDDIPKGLGKWEGKDVELDPKVFRATGARYTANRSYHDGTGGELALHLALYTQPGNGLDHQPPHCYLLNGWLQKEVVPMSLKDADGKRFDIWAGRWERDGKKILIAYWYQIDDRIIFNRLDMGLARFEMRNIEVWPPLIKVLLQINTESPAEDIEQLERVGQEIFDWTNREKPAPAKSSAPR